LPAREILRAMRPHQWVKNLVIFAALIFSERLDDPSPLLHAALAFLVFCMLSSTVYLFNDIRDRENDARHPVKRLRPLASGRLSVGAASMAAGALLVVAVILAWLLGPGFFRVAVAYLLLNLLYSLRLRRVVILDILCIASGFVLRAIAGAEVLQDIGLPVAISPWLLMCTFLLSLFLGLGKRYHEVSVVSDAHRASLRGYSPRFVERLLVMTASATLISYCLYTIWPDTVRHFGTHRLLYTTPFVFYGLARYLFLVTEEHEGGDPSETLVKEPSIMSTVGLWFLAVAWILYLG
jgi:4-hydroxybenzoate polyprenyltransferase